MMLRLHMDVRIIAEVEHLQSELMLVQAGAGIAFVPDALSNVSIAGIVFRQFTPDRGRIVVHAAWPDGTTTGLVAQFLRVEHAVMAHKLAHQAWGNRVTNAIPLHEVGGTAGD